MSHLYNKFNDINRQEVVWDSRDDSNVPFIINSTIYI